MSDDRPLARSEDVSVERLPGETLVYDEERDDVHCLSGAAAEVFDLCDGVRSRAEIAAQVSERLSQPFDEATLGDVLAELRERHLLAGEPAAAGGLSRRQVIRKGALVGAGAAMITTIAAPSASAAQSAKRCKHNNDCPRGQVCSGGRSVCCIPDGGPCTPNSDCCGSNPRGQCVNGACVHG